MWAATPSFSKGSVYSEESDIRPSMVTHTRNLCSAFIPSKVHTHSSEHTHTVNTHPEQWAAIYAAVPGEQLGVRCLAQGPVKGNPGVFKLKRGLQRFRKSPFSRVENKSHVFKNENALVKT